MNNPKKEKSPFRDINNIEHRIEVLKKTDELIDKLMPKLNDADKKLLKDLIDYLFSL